MTLPCALPMALSKSRSNTLVWSSIGDGTDGRTCIECRGSGIGILYQIIHRGGKRSWIFQTKQNTPVFVRDMDQEVV